MNIDIKVPKKLIPIWKPYRYKILYGGRSSAKTATIIRYLITRALEKTTKILCTREFQSSIQTSTYAELKAFIYENNLTNFLEVKYDRIISKIPGNYSEFIFKGLARDIMQIKSIPDIDICFVEEAETTIDMLWDVLIPSIRKEGSELIIAFNPRDRNSATYQRFIESNQNDNELRIEINYFDNPFNSQTILDEIEKLRITNYAKYEHIYLGKVLDITEDVIFKGKFKIEKIDIKYTPQKIWLYNKNQKIVMKYGIDFGFSVDPCAMIELCFLDKDTIYINREVYETKLLPRHYIPKIKKEFPESQGKKWYCDSARPDTIAELKQDGLNCEGAEKGKGSVESGIEYLLSKNIIVNPSCSNMIFELYNYKYKIDKKTNNITIDIIDANNHLIDAMRYALVDEIRAGKRKPLKINPNAFKQLGIQL